MEHIFVEILKNADFISDETVNYSTIQSCSVGKILDVITHTFEATQEDNHKPIDNIKIRGCSVE